MKRSKIAVMLLSSSLFLATHAANAKTENIKADPKRAEKVAELLIAIFAQDPNRPTKLNIQFGAAIAGISEDEAYKNLSKDGQQAISSPAVMMKTALSGEFNADEMKIVGPAIDKQLLMQSSIIKSCKLSGKMTQPTKTSYEFPVSCQIPQVDWDTAKKPDVNPEASDANNFATMLNWMVDSMAKAPQQPLNTRILVNQNGSYYVPEMDDGNYFPNSVTRQIIGAAESD